jgi:hypothetical protein
MQQNDMSVQDLIRHLSKYAEDLSAHYNDVDTEAFVKTMMDFRTFLKDSMLLSPNSTEQATAPATTAFNNLISNHKKDYFEFRNKFKHAEHNFERIIEMSDNERLLEIKGDSVALQKLHEYITNEFNRLFYTDVVREIDDLHKYFIQNHPFLMVGCGSLPTTLLLYCQKYPNERFVGIDNSAEAIYHAKKLKQQFQIANLSFDMIDGVDYNYENVSTILVANSVKPKMKVLKQIAMSAKQGTRIIIRIPHLAGNLFSEDVDYQMIPRVRRIEEIFLTHDNVDAMLFTRVVLEIQ